MNPNSSFQWKELFYFANCIILNFMGMMDLICFINR